MFRILLIFLSLFLVSCSDEASSALGHTTYAPPSSTMEKRPTLVIRLNFSNETFTENETSWQQKIFGTDKGELNDYYHEISANQFEFSPVRDDGLVHNGIVTLDINKKHPNPRPEDRFFDSDIKEKVHPILKSSIQQLSNNGFDFSLYDSDHNNIITPRELVVIFIFAGQEDAYALNKKNGIWAHEWCTEDLTTIVNNVEIMNCYEGDYAAFGERHGSHDATIGIIAHELGHVAFQLPDLYYGSDTRIGYYGLMSNGSWGQAEAGGEAGDTPTHMCAWSKIDTGWYTPSTTSEMYDEELVATGSSQFNIIKVPIYKTNAEYFLLENRGTHGYDSGLNIIDYKSTLYTGGVAIWHIDESVIRLKRNDNTINADANHKGVDLEEAAGASVDSGNGEPKINFFYSGNVDHFTPSTLPNSNLYDGTSSTVSITNISTSAETMSLSIRN